MNVTLQMTIPKYVMKADDVQKAIILALEKVSYPHVRDDFKQTVYGWSPENKPHFTKRLTVHTHEISLFIYAREDAAGNIYRLVSSGSPPHAIYPKRPGGFLKFRPGYRSATTPGMLKSRRAYRSGKPVYRKKVMHPGFEPRHFDELVAEEYAPYFEHDIQEQIIDVIKPSEASDWKTLRENGIL